MGIFSKVKRRGDRWLDTIVQRALVGTPIAGDKSAGQYIQATVRRGEAVYRQRGYNAQDMADIARVMAWVWWAGKFNASNTCSVPIRLYRPGAGPGSKTYPGVRVSRARQKWLRGDGQHRPNHKAMVYGANSDDIEEVLEHPALELLAYGNRWVSGREVMERLHLSLEWTGNAYWHVDIGASSNRPAEVFALLPQHTRIQPSDTDFIDGYWYGREGHIETWFEGDRFRGANRTLGEVDHWKANPSPVDPYYGRSWVDFLHREIDIYDAARENELARWDNNARPDYAIMLTGEGVNQDSADRLKAKIMAEHRGPRSAGRIMVLAGEQASLAPLNFSAKEMEYLAGLTNVRDTILSVADIPSTMVDKAGVVANSAEGRRQYMETAILPRLVKFVDTLNDRLLPRFGVEAGEMWFAFDNPVPQDEALTIQRVQSYVPIGVLTINEARAMEGLDPSDDEMADAHLYNGQPVGQAPPDPFGFGGGGGRDAEGATDGDTADEDIEEAAEAATDDEPGAGDGREPKAFAFPGAEPAEPAPGESSAQDESKVAPCCCGAEHGAKNTGPLQDPPDRAFLEAVARYMSGVAAGLVRHAQSSGIDVESTVTAILGDEIVQQLADIIMGGTQGPLTQGAREGLARVQAIAGSAADGLSTSFDIGAPDVQRYLERHRLIIEETARDITETTGEIMRGVVARVNEEGGSNAKLAQELAAQFEEVNHDRALMIARTETANAQVSGRRMAWQKAEDDLGLKLAKRWMLAPNPCQYCRAIAAKKQTLGLDEPFLKAGDTLTGIPGPREKRGTMKIKRDVQGPPLHPNDRCDIEVVDLEDEG